MRFLTREMRSGLYIRKQADSFRLHGTFGFSVRL